MSTINAVVPGTSSYIPPATAEGVNRADGTTGATPGQKELSTEETKGHITPGKSQAEVANLPPPKSEGGTSVSKAMANYGNAEMQGDMMAFMAIFQQIAQTLRTSNRESRVAETAAQVTSLNASADKITEAANLRYSAAQIQADYAIAASAVTIGLSVASIGMTAGSAYKSYKGSQSTQMGESIAAEPKNLSGVDTKFQSTMKADASAFSAAGNKLSAQGAALGGSARTMGELGQGISGTIKAAGDKKASEDEKGAAGQDALGAKDQAEAKMHEANSQIASDVMQAMQDIIRDIKEKVQAMEQAQVDTVKAIARNV
jgi:hypothetical protein